MPLNNIASHKHNTAQIQFRANYSFGSLSGFISGLTIFTDTYSYYYYQDVGAYGLGSNVSELPLAYCSTLLLLPQDKLVQSRTRN